LSQAEYRLKQLVGRSPVLYRLLGELRWYVTPAFFYQTVAAIRRADRTVQCPICGWRGSSFYPFGVVRRPNAACPRCGAKERHRLLALYLKHRTDLPNKPIRALEIAPGRYSYRLFRNMPRAVHVTLDYESPLANIRGDVTRLPFRPSTFDLVLCYHVLEHVVDDHRAMTELRRVLKDDGLCLVDVPIDGRELTHEDLSITDPRDRLRLFGQEDHVRAYGKDFVDRLNRAGFAVRVEGLAATLPEGTMRLHGLVRDEVLYACTTIP
jgi:SAM-dependent methyltransferase